MSLFVPQTASNMPEWVRKVATAINSLLGGRGFPFPPADADPADPKPGQGYYNTVTNKARVWDGTVWTDLW